MTYDPNVPSPSSSPASSVADIQTNFDQFDTIFQRNHVALNDFNQGKHSTMVFQNQSAAPGVTEDLVALFSLNATASGGTQPQLFAQIPKFLPTALDTTNASNIPMQLTYNVVNTSGPQYQSFMAGGFVVYFGSTNNIAASIVLSPTPTKILTALAFASGVATGGLDSSVVITQPGTIKINSTNAPGGTVFFWYAIGSA